MTNNEILKKQIEILKAKHKEYIAKSNFASASVNIYNSQASTMADAIDVLEKALEPEAPSPVFSIPRLIVQCSFSDSLSKTWIKRKNGKSFDDPSLPKEFVVRIVD